MGDKPLLCEVACGDPKLLTFSACVFGSATTDCAQSTAFMGLQAIPTSSCAYSLGAKPSPGCTSTLTVCSTDGNGVTVFCPAVTTTSAPATSFPLTTSKSFEGKPTQAAATVISTSSSSAQTTVPLATSASATISTSASAKTASSTVSSSGLSGNITASAGSRSGLSSGAAAGVGIGGVIAGAILAGLAFLFLFARYKKRHQQTLGNHSPNNNMDIARQEKGQSTAMKNGSTIVESYLPQPAEDDAINAELSRLRDKIKDHIQSYYHTKPVNSQLIDMAQLQAFTNDTGIQVAKLKELVSSPHSRAAALRLCVAWLIVSRCDGYGPAGESLLPPEIASFAALIARSDPTDTRKAALVRNWKVTSGALLQRSGQQQRTDSARIGRGVEQTVAAANALLAPFVASPTDPADKRLRNMESIATRASQLGLLLFTQPSVWAFDWKTGGSGTGRIVVFPGLMEVVDESGLMQQPPRQFSQPEVVTMV